MKALIYKKFGRPEVLEWVEDWPYPELDPDSVLVEMVAGSINPKDALLRKGMFSKTLARDALPRASGMDGAGRIISVGENVSDFAVGDAVFAMTNHFAGGVHVEVAKFHHSELQHAPNNIPLIEAASVPLACLTALQALRDCCALKSSHKVLINGASGGVGHFAVQIAKAYGAEVHAVCGASNIDFVTSLGADVVYDYRVTSVTQIETRFDAVFDVFGKQQRSDFADQLLDGGIYVSTVPKFNTLWGEFLARTGISKSNRLVQVESKAQDLLQLKEWIEQGVLIPHVEKYFPVNNYIDAHRHIESKHTIGKICLTF